MTIDTAVDALDCRSLSAFVRDNSIKGFLAEDEACELHRLAVKVSHLGPCLEVGSYCGKSTLYIGEACKYTDNSLYAIDHHRGSEEHQVGEQYHDPDLYDHAVNRFNSFPAFMRTLELADLCDTVVPVVTSSRHAARHWATPLALVFIDGGHSHEMAREDCVSWARHLCVGGILAIHDVFDKPEAGGQGPYLALQHVLASGDFALLGQVNSLGIAQRKRAHADGV